MSLVDDDYDDDIHSNVKQPVYLVQQYYDVY